MGLKSGLNSLMSTTLVTDLTEVADHNAELGAIITISKKLSGLKTSSKVNSENYIN